MLLAWAKGRERFACVADSPSSGAQGEVRIFELNAAGDQLTMATLQGACTESSAECATRPHEYAYSSSRATEQARAFSPSGRWFSFASADSGTDNYLYWADLNASGNQVEKAYYVSAATTANSPTEISFSPDEAYVLLRRGKELRRWPLTKSPRSAQSVAKDMDLGQTCSDEFMSGPDQWCGNTDRAALFHWAPDSAAVAFRAASEVRVFEFSNNYTYPLPAPACEGQCDEQFAFQPLLAP